MSNTATFTIDTSEIVGTGYSREEDMASGIPDIGILEAKSGDVVEQFGIPTVEKWHQPIAESLRGQQLSEEIRDDDEPDSDGFYLETFKRAVVTAIGQELCSVPIRELSQFV